MDRVAEPRVRRSQESKTVMRKEQAKPAEEAVDSVERSPDSAPGGPGVARTEGDAPDTGAVGGYASAAEEALAAAEQDLARHRDAMLRMQAEMENQHKRLLRESEKSRKFALERIMKDLLQVLDSMERGLEVADDSATVDSLREGQALTLKMLAKVLQDHDLEVIDPSGQPFDPEWHEAMTVAPSEELEENTVMEVLQKGYRLHDRLIRPAMVVVSRKP